MKAPVSQETTTALLRIVSGLMLWQHGAAKLFGWWFTPDGAPRADSWFSLVGIAGILEFFLPILVILGIRTRFVSFIICGQFAVTYWWRHFFDRDPLTWWPLNNGGELAILYCAIFLFLWTAGSGRWSLDDRIPGPGASKPGAPMM